MIPRLPSSDDALLWLRRLADEPASVDALRAALARLTASAAESVPVLSSALAADLVRLADALPYRRARPVIGEGSRAVYQQFDYCDRIPACHPVLALRDWLETTINQALDGIEPRPLSDAIRFNDVVCQRYRVGDRGISPHRDHIRYTGLVVIVVLDGDARYCVCADRGGDDARPVPAAPGWAVLMPGPGYAGRSDRPFHFVDRIRAMRHTVGIRHDYRSQTGA